MSTKSNHNALVHGVYSSDVILPWESADDFDALLDGIRMDFMPRGTTEDDIVFEIAVLHWKKRRVNRLLQLEFLQTSLAAELEKSGKRSASGIHRFFKVQHVKERHEKAEHSTAVVKLSEAVTSLAGDVKSKKSSLGKLGANMRSVVADIEKLRPSIEAGAKSVDEAKKIDGAYSLDTIGSACELEARFDALIEKKIQRLIIIREFKRQYGQDSNVKLLPHHPLTARGSAAKKTVTKGGRKASSKKSTDANDNWNDNDNNNNDNDNQINPDNYDWEHEYDEALAEQKKARRKRRVRKD